MPMSNAKDNEVLTIFVPEWVPLTNKGEGAIVLGMGDVLFPDKTVQLSVLDMKTDIPYEKDGIKVYPGKWFYANWRSKEFGIALSWERLFSSFCSLLRNGLNKLFPQWINIPTLPLRKLDRCLYRFEQKKPARNDYERGMYEIFQCDYIIGGHNGGLNEYVCQVLSMFKKHGRHFGIFGSSLKPSVRPGAVMENFRNCMAKADFIYVRNQIALDWAKKYFPEIDVRLTPDPAFGMLPENEKNGLTFLKNHPCGFLFKKEKPLILVTSCEPTPIARKSFLDITSPIEKLQAHRKFMADFMDYILEKTDANIVFLPHSIGPEKALDDRIVARSITRFMKDSSSRVFIIEDDISGRLLKYLIAQADLLIAERIHSIIGSVKVNTPFLAIGSSADTRIRGIVGTMLHAEKRTYLLDHPKKEEIQELFDSVWNNLPQIRQEQTVINTSVISWLSKDSQDIRKIIESALK